MKKNNQLLAIVTATLFASVSGVYAQNVTAPDKVNKAIDRRLNTIEKEAEIKQQGDPVVTGPIGRAELPPVGGATVVLKTISFEPPSAFITPSMLDDIADKYRGKKADFSKISELVRDVNDLYAALGIVTAAAILPPQDITTGNLVVKLVEGQRGAIAIVGQKKVSGDYILNRIRTASGTTVDPVKAASDINRFNKTNSAQLRLLLQPGAAFGTTDLTFGVTEPKENQLQFIIDNLGVASTGLYEGSAIYRKYGALGIDDTFLLYGIASEGSKAFTTQYDIPISRYGTRLTAGYSFSDVHVIDGPTAVLDITGQSQSGTLSLTHPLFINNDWSVLATGSAFYGVSKTLSAGVPLVDSRTIKYAPGISIGYSNDTFSISNDVQWVFAGVDDYIAATNGNYQVLAGSMAASINLANNHYISFNGGWQWTNEKLLPGNLLFQIGGPTTVRGYPSDGIAGDSGYYANVEVHKAFVVNDKVVDAFIFTDFGSVYSTSPARTTLFSAGVGANIQLSQKASLELSLASPLYDTLSNQRGITAYASLVVNIF